MTEFKYERKFAPNMLQKQTRFSETVADARLDPPYAYTEQIILAVNVAMATGRPLLVRGASGTGKSSLAINASRVLGWRYYETVVTSRTRAQDLLWEVDLLRRLDKAQSRDDTVGDDYTPYINPGVLWWAFQPGSAERRGREGGKAELKDPSDRGSAKTPAVVLLDEIDKADPDEPNNLLVPLGSLEFTVNETQAEIVADKKRPPLVFITTNNERELPKAFLRRCVELCLPDPTRARLLDIARLHFKGKVRLAQSVLHALCGLGKDDDPVEGLSPAEFIDTIRACVQLKVQPDESDAAWNAIQRTTVYKAEADGEETAR